MKYNQKVLVLRRHSGGAWEYSAAGVERLLSLIFSDTIKALN